jgi:hypothetical protein
VPAQEFSVRSDMACGSTIGPILASSLGCRTVDVGAPQLSMHSIREMCGVDDVGHSYRHFLAFFQVPPSVCNTLVRPQIGQIWFVQVLGMTSPLLRWMGFIIRIVSVGITLYCIGSGLFR